MHLHADNLNVAHFRRAFVNRSDLVQCDAELVFLGAGRDVMMRMRVDIRVDAQCDWRAHFLCAGYALDQIQFSFTLDVEAVDALLQSILNFLTGFADAREGAFGRIAARREHTKQLATGNDVEAGARTYEQVQDRAIRVRFYRITNQVIQRRERRVESRVVIENCPRAVDVSRRAEFRGNAR